MSDVPKSFLSEFPDEVVLRDCVLDWAVESPNKPPSYSVQIAEILEHIEFEKINEIMFRLGWYWRINCDDSSVPSVDLLKKKAREQLEDVAKRGHGTWSGFGGFHAANNYGFLKLAFELTEWDMRC